MRMNRCGPAVEGTDGHEPTRRAALRRRVHQVQVRPVPARHRRRRRACGRRARTPSRTRRPRRRAAPCGPPAAMSERRGSAPRPRRRPMATQPAVGADASAVISAREGADEARARPAFPGARRAGCRGSRAGPSASCRPRPAASSGRGSASPHAERPHALGVRLQRLVPRLAALDERRDPAEQREHEQDGRPGQQPPQPAVGPPLALGARARPASRLAARNAARWR